MRAPEGFEVVIRGDGVGVAVPVVPEVASPEVREGLARRRLALLEGRCPCGATPPRISRQQRRAAKRWGEVVVMLLDHAEDCPAEAPETARWVGARMGWST